MPYDTKYGRVTTEHGDLPDDEIVFIFRGRDSVLPGVLRYYHDICAEAGSPDHHLDLIEQNRRDVVEWQRVHADRVQVPNSNRYFDRLGDT